MKGTSQRDDEKIWRYLYFQKFAALVSSSTLWFARLDTLEDKWEGLSRAIPYAPPPNGGEAHKKYEELVRQHHEWRLKLRTRSFVSCWTLEESESIPLWKIYGSYEAGVAIQSTSSRFTESVRFPRQFPAHATGPVSYYDAIPAATFDYPKSVEFSWEKEFEISLQKRSSFKFEKEWRAIIVGNGRDKARGIQVPVAIDNLLENLFVSPAASERFLETVAAVAEKFGLKITPQRSMLARPRPRVAPPIGSPT